MSPLPQRASHVLVVDDDPGIRDLLGRYLDFEDYTVESVSDGTAALEAVRLRTPDIVLLDVMLGAESGFDVLSQIRQETRLPVIIVTGRDDEASRVKGEQLGADDYVVKPFAGEKLMARIAAVLMSARRATSSLVLSFDDVKIDLTNREVTRSGVAVELTTQEYDLLALLACSPGQVFSREHLIERAWGPSADVKDTATVTEHVGRLRRKLESKDGTPRRLRSVRGVGYSFDA